MEAMDENICQQQCMCIFVGVDCPVGDIGPRSVLILNYKGHYTSVHV